MGATNHRIILGYVAGFVSYSTWYLSTIIEWREKPFNPSRTAALFWGLVTQFSSSLSPKRDCCPTSVEVEIAVALRRRRE